MDQLETQKLSQDQVSREDYLLKDTEFQRMMAERRAAKQGGFFIPHLKAGMYLLDCGCGPGSITMDLAQMIAPGKVVGIDIDEGEVNRAHVAADAAGIGNIEFRLGDVYALPFPDRTFDAVFSNAVLDHLSEPEKALRELFRVLKPGGVAGVRTADRDGYLISPANPVLERAFQRFEEQKRQQGVRARIGKHLRSLMRKAGFANVEASASYDYYGTTESVLALSEALASRQEQYPMTGDAALVAAAWREWGQSPDAFFAQSYCEAVGGRA